MVVFLAINNYYRLRYWSWIVLANKFIAMKSETKLLKLVKVSQFGTRKFRFLTIAFAVTLLNCRWKILINTTNRMFVKCNKIKQISLSWINRHSKRVEIRVRHFIDSFNCFFNLYVKGYRGSKCPKRKILFLDFSFFECFLISRNQFKPRESNFNHDCFSKGKKGK